MAKERKYSDEFNSEYKKLRNFIKEEFNYSESYITKKFDLTKESFKEKGIEFFEDLILKHYEEFESSKKYRNYRETLKNEFGYTDYEINKVANLNKKSFQEHDEVYFLDLIENHRKEIEKKKLDASINKTNKILDDFDSGKQIEIKADPFNLFNFPKDTLKKPEPVAKEETTEEFMKKAQQQKLFTDEEINNQSHFKFDNENPGETWLGQKSVNYSNGEKQFDENEKLKSINKIKREQIPLFDEEGTPHINPRREELLKKKQFLDDLLKTKGSDYIDDDWGDLGNVVKTYPLQFFNAKDDSANQELLDFFNTGLNDAKNGVNNRNLKVKMVGFSEEGMRIRQLKAEAMDRDYFGDKDVLDKRVMVFLPEGQEKKTAIGVVREGNGFLKFVEVDMEYKDGEAFVKNIGVKASGSFADPYGNELVKKTLNNVNYINVRKIANEQNGVQGVLNEDYNFFFKSILNRHGNTIAIKDIDEEISKGQRLLNGNILQSIYDYTNIIGAYGVASDSSHSVLLPISGENIVESIFDVPEEIKEIIQEKGYNKGRYQISVGREGKIDKIFKAVNNNGKIEYVEDKEMFNTIFKEISQYTDSNVMERLKVVDTDIKPLMSTENVIKFNEKILNMDRTSAKEVESAAIEFRDTIFNEFAQTYGYNNYTELLKETKENKELKELHKVFLDKFKRIDIETMKARIETGQLFDNRLVEIKDKTTSAGIERIISGAITHPFSYLNKDSARKTQGIQQMSAMTFKNILGEEVAVADLLDKHTNHIKELNRKKIKIRKTAEERILSLFGAPIFHENYKEPKLDSNVISYLYVDSKDVFNDSTTISAEAFMKNISAKGETKTIRIDYSSFNNKILKDLDENYGSIGDLIAHLRKNGLDLSKGDIEGSFEEIFLKNLLGKNRYNKFRKYQYTNDMEDNLKSIGRLFEGITSLKTEEDIKAYAEAINKAQKIYNNTIKSNMVLSESDSILNLINKSVINKDTKGYVSDATAGLIEDIRATGDAIEIDFSPVALQNSGKKIMIGSTKATQGRMYDAMFYTVGGENVMVDALVNNKLSNAKRGNAGTILSESIETMFRNTLSADFKVDMTDEEKVEFFKKKFKSRYLGNNKKLNVLDLLNLDITIENGEILFRDLNIENALDEVDTPMSMDPYATLEKRIRENFSANLEKLFGYKKNANDSESLFNGILDMAYYAYEDILNEMKDGQQNANRVLIKDPVITKVYRENGEEKFIREKVKGYAYNFIDRMTGMKESTSRKTKNAMKLSRISQLMGMTSGNADFINLVRDMAYDQNKDSISTIMSVYDLDRHGNMRNKELFSEFIQDAGVIDLSDKKFRDLGHGIADTAEGFKAGPLGSIMKDIKNPTGEVDSKRVKGLITGFQEDFVESLDNFFKNTRTANEEMSRIMFFSTTDEIINQTMKEHFTKEMMKDGVGSEIESKMMRFREMIVENYYKEQDVVKFNRFNVDSEDVRNGLFDKIYAKTIDDVIEKLGIKQTDEFLNFKNVEKEINALMDTAGSNDQDYNALIKIAKDKLGIAIPSGSNSRNNDIDFIRKNIQMKKLKDFGLEGVADVFKTSKHFNEDYSKFSYSVVNMMNRLSENMPESDFDFTTFTHLMDFKDLNLEILDKNMEELSNNDILKSIIKNQNSLSDGKVYHLSRLKQIANQKQLQIYLTGILTDAEGRLIPNSGLADLIAMVKYGSSMHVNKEMEEEYKKVSSLSNDLTSGKIKHNKRMDSISDTLGSLFLTDETVKKRNLKEASLNKFLSIFGSDVEFDKIYEDNRYSFYRTLSRFASNVDGDPNNPVLDEEIRKKFIAYKKKISQYSVGISNSLATMLDNYGVENSEYMSKVAQTFAKEDIELDEFINGVLDLQKILYSSGDKYNKSSLTAINTSLNEFQRFLDSLIKDDIEPLFHDLGYIAKNAINTDDLNDFEFSKVLNVFASSEENSVKMQYARKWLSPIINAIDDKTKTNFKGKNQTELIERVLNIYEKMAQGLFGKDGQIEEALTYVAENSARFSPRDASFVQDIVTEEIRNAFKSKKLKTRDLKLSQVEDFVKVVYGEDASKEIRKKLKVFKKNKKVDIKDLNWINKYLEDRQNIVIGTKEMYSNSGLNLDFGKNQYAVYGLLQRDPSQFHGSMSATRYVSIDRNNKRFRNRMYNKLFANTNSIDNTSNFMLIGKKTSLWANGDFDGDTYQALLLGLRNKKLIKEYQESVSKFGYVKSGYGEELSDTLKLQNLIMNSGDSDLIKDFEEPVLKNENEKAIKKLILKLYGDEDLTPESTNKEIFDKVKKYYIKHLYYKNIIQESLDDEIAKHAKTQLTGKTIDGISAFALSDLASAMKNRKEQNELFKENYDIKKFEKFLKDVKLSNKESMDELKSHSVENIYKALKKALKGDGGLGISNLEGSENKILEFASIARTGRFHDSITEYREFSMAFNNKELRSHLLNGFRSEIARYYKQDNYNKFTRLLDDLGEGTFDNVFGEMIEKGSIGGKHGAAANPYGLIEKLNNIMKVTNRSNDDFYIRLDKANEALENILINSQNTGNKVISDDTILDYARKLVDGGEQGGNYKVQAKIQELATSIGDLLGVKGEDVAKVKMADIEGISATNLVGTLYAANVAAAKGHVQKVTGTTNIARGVIHQANAKKSEIGKINLVMDMIHGDKTGNKKNAGLSVDTSGFVLSAKKVLGKFFGAKEETTGAKEAAETASDKAGMSQEEINKANAYGNKWTNTRKKTGDDADKYGEELREAYEKIKNLSKQNEELQRTIEEQAKKIGEMAQDAASAGSSSTASSAADSAANAASEAAEQATKAAQKNSEVIDEAADGGRKLSDAIKKHKNIAGIAVAALVLGSFFKIFQSNRPVINLDINEKQYEKSQGSIYRDLNQYTINTNIRELY